jgi:hypothetical protein
MVDKWLGNLSSQPCTFFIENWELVQYLVEKRKTIDFSKPVYAVARQDSDVIMQRILSVSYSDWKKMG